MAKQGFLGIGTLPLVLLHLSLSAYLAPLMSMQTWSPLEKCHHTQDKVYKAKQN